MVSIQVCGTRISAAEDHAHCVQVRCAHCSRQGNRLRKLAALSEHSLRTCSSCGRPYQQRKVKDGPSNTSLTDSMEAFSNKLCAANRACMCIILQPRVQEPPSSGVPTLACVDVFPVSRPPHRSAVTPVSQSQTYQYSQPLFPRLNATAAASGRRTRWLLPVRLESDAPEAGGREQPCMHDAVTEGVDMSRLGPGGDQGDCRSSACVSPYMDHD